MVSWVSEKCINIILPTATLSIICCAQLMIAMLLYSCKNCYTHLKKNQVWMLNKWVFQSLLFHATESLCMFTQNYFHMGQKLLAPSTAKFVWINPTKTFTYLLSVCGDGVLETVEFNQRKPGLLRVSNCNNDM